MTKIANDNIPAGARNRAVQVQLFVPIRGLSREHAAAFFGVSPSKFDEMRKDGRVGPAKLVDGRKVWDVRLLDVSFDELPDEFSHDAEPWRAA